MTEYCFLVPGFQNLKVYERLIKLQFQPESFVIVKEDRITNFSATQMISVVFQYSLHLQFYCSPNAEKFFSQARDELHKPAFLSLTVEIPGITLSPSLCLYIFQSGWLHLKHLKQQLCMEKAQYVQHYFRLYCSLILPILGQAPSSTSVSLRF